MITSVTLAHPRFLPLAFGVVTQPVPVLRQVDADADPNDQFAFISGRGIRMIHLRSMAPEHVTPALRNQYKRQQAGTYRRAT
jgi:hypothetical protein